MEELLKLLKQHIDATEEASRLRGGGDGYYDGVLDGLNMARIDAENLAISQTRAKVPPMNRWKMIILKGAFEADNESYWLSYSAHPAMVTAAFRLVEKGLIKCDFFHAGGMWFNITDRGAKVWEGYSKK